MYQHKTVYVAERVREGDDGKRYRIRKTTEGPFEHLHPDLDEYVATLREEQARKLRDSLNEVLDS